MGSFEPVERGFAVIEFLILFGAIVVLGAGIVTSMFKASAIYSSSVRAGMVAGCMSATALHSGAEVLINWNLRQIDMGTTENLFVAVTDEIGWVAFPDMILDMPSYASGEDESPIFEAGEVPGWIVRGNAIENIIITSNSTGRGVKLE